LPKLTEVNDCILKWSQGDVLQGIALPFLHIAEASLPLTEASRLVAEATEQSDDMQLVPVADRGPDQFMILSQTCDLVRSYQTRAFIEVAPLAPANDDDQLRNSLRGKIPRFYSNELLAERGMLVDLDRVMTIEKSLLMFAEQWPCCRDPQHLTSLQRSLARKRARFAFPDDFVEAMRPVQKRVQEKHKKESPEGEFLRSVREIRVMPDPDWQADEVDLTFYFIFDSDEEISDDYREAAKTLCSCFFPSTKYPTPEPVVISITHMSAAVYLQAAQLDFDHLSDDQQQ